MSGPRSNCRGSSRYRRRDLPRDPPAKPLILSEVPRQRYDATIPEIPPGIIDNLPGHVATVTPISSRRAKTDRLIRTPTKNPAGAGLSAGPSGASRRFGPRLKQDRSCQNPAKAPLSRAFTALLCSAQSLNHCRNVACIDPCDVFRDPRHLTPPRLPRRSIGLDFMEWRPRAEKFLQLLLLGRADPKLAAMFRNIVLSRAGNANLAIAHGFHDRFLLRGKPAGRRFVR